MWKANKVCILLRSRYWFLLSSANDSTFNPLNLREFCLIMTDIALNFSTDSLILKNKAFKRLSLVLTTNKKMTSTIVMCNTHDFHLTNVGITQLVLVKHCISQVMVKTVNPLKLRILPYDKCCFKFLNLSSWTHSLKKKPSLIQIAFIYIFVMTYEKCAYI